MLLFSRLISHTDLSNEISLFMNELISCFILHRLTREKYSFVHVHTNV